MPRGDWGVASQTLTIPPFGGTSTFPRFVIGPDVPAELVTYYAGLGRTIFFAVLKYFSSTFYFYEGMVYTPGGNFFIVEGHVLGGVPSGDSYVFFDGAISKTVYGIGTGTDVDFIQIGDDTTDVAIAIDAGTGQIFVGDTGAGGIFIEPGAGTVSISATGNWTFFDGTTTVSLPRGTWAAEAGQASSAAIGAETVLITLPSATYQNGRAYRFSFGGWATASVANIATFRIREGTTVAGTLQASPLDFVGVAGQAVPMESEIILRCTGTVTEQWVLTVAASAGTITQNGSATRPRWFRAEDVGENGDYSNYPSF